MRTRSGPTVVLSRLGWDETTFLVAVRDGGRVVVRAADDSPEATPVPVDGDRRLTLPPGVLAILGRPPGRPGRGLSGPGHR